MKDRTFKLIGIEILVILLIIAFIFAKTFIEWLAFIGVIIFIECFCFVCHLIVNDKGRQ